MAAYFILSTGRCGTQWLYDRLRAPLEAHGFWVTHEPLHYGYCPTENSPSRPLVRNACEIEGHADAIQDHLDKGGHYLECGFPAWRHLPWFQKRLNGPVKVIYLHRDPIQTASSWLKQNAFVPPFLPHQTEKTWFSPSAEGACLPQYQERWTGLTPFEKNLYFWAEVQLHARQYRQNWSSNDWLTVRFEELFTDKRLEQLGYFLVNQSLVGSQIDKSPYDQHSGIPQTPVVESKMQNHPEILRIAKQLQYHYSFDR